MLGEQAAFPEIRIIGHTGSTPRPNPPAVLTAVPRARNRCGQRRDGRAGPGGCVKC